MKEKSKKIRFSGTVSVGGFTIADVFVEVDVGDVELTKDDKMKLAERLVDGGMKELGSWTIE